MSETVEFRAVFAELLDDGLTEVTARRAFDAILQGQWTPTQIAGLLTALRVQGEAPTTIAAAAASMRAAMVRVEHTQDRVLDTCGTGGDGQDTVNISTAAAVICAACGETVGKHGNRAVSSRSGSADVLVALGIPTDLPPEAASTLLREIGIAFMLAPKHHPAMRFAVPVRRELKVRTIFNCLGPLANPAGATHQLVGAFANDLRSTLANTLAKLGTRRAWVVRGEDGLDEISPYAKTRVTQLDGGILEEFTVAPEDFGIQRSTAGAAKGGTAEENAAIIRAVLSGEKHPARDAIILNAAAALVVARGCPLRDAAQQASAAVDDGSAGSKLVAWQSAASALRPAEPETA